MATSAPRTVLVVEDSDDDFTLLSLSFRSAGLRPRIERVKSGEAAIEYLRGEKRFSDRDAHPFPDLLLMDIKMQGLSGFDVLRFIVAHPEMKPPAVVVMSGSIVKEDAAQAMEMGAQAYLAKPVDMDGYVEMARKIDREFLGVNS